MASIMNLCPEWPFLGMCLEITDMKESVLSMPLHDTTAEEGSGSTGHK